MLEAKAKTEKERKANKNTVIQEIRKQNTKHGAKQNSP